MIALQFLCNGIILKCAVLSSIFAKNKAMRFPIFILFLFVFFPHLAYPQTPVRLRGIVYDSVTNRQVPFTYVIINQGITGGSTDLDGKFDFEVKQNIERVTFTHLGYEQVIYNIKTPQDLQALQGFLRIALKPKEDDLNEITLTGINPAHKLVKLALKNRDLHNPKKLPFYSYNTYTKFVVDSEGSQNLVVPPPSDTANHEAIKFLKNNYILLIESVTAYKFLAPTYQYEKVIANRVSGLQNPQFIAMSTQGQALNFYEDYLTLLNRKYLNPISQNSWERYDFSIEDTILVKSDTLFWLSFEPMEGKNFDGLKGRIAIHSRSYAIQCMELESALPEKESSVGFRIEQQHEWIDEQRWFTKQIRTELTFRSLKIRDKRVVAQTNIYFSDFDFKNKPPLRDFRDVSLEIDNEAHLQTQEKWANYRTDTLNTRENNTYTNLDSLGKKVGFDKFLRISQVLTFARLPLRIKGKKRTFEVFDIDLSHLLQYNRYEKFRLGIGLITSDAFSKRWVFGGYFAYGFGDRRIKYGYSAMYRPFLRTDASITVSYRDDVREPARIRFMEENKGLALTPDRKLFTTRMDILRQFEVKAQMRPLQNLRLGAIFSKQFILPTYAYEFQIPKTDSLASQTEFQLTELSVQLQYFWGAKYMRIGTVRSLTGITLPAFFLSYTQGLNAWGSKFSYQKWQARLWYEHTFRNAGTTQMEVSAGYAVGALPYHVLWNGHGAGRQVPAAIPNYFQTMGMYEFLVDSYAYVFLRHNFRRLLYKSPYEHFQPELVLHHNFGLGSLRNPTEHMGAIEVRDFRRGFWESGLMINDLYKYKSGEAIRVGLGAGVFVRYGAYRDFDRFNNNLFYKISTTISI